MKVADGAGVRQAEGSDRQEQPQKSAMGEGGPILLAHLEEERERMKTKKQSNIYNVLGALWSFPVCQRLMKLTENKE